MRSFLEIESMNARHEMETRSDYTRVNQYSETHPDALATGDRQGKGTGHPGHGDWLPHCTSQINVFNFSNFDTAITSNAGNGNINDPQSDVYARNAAMTKSLYSPTNPYNEGANSIDTSLNVLEGQYVIS